MIENFFAELDELWNPLGSEPITLPVFGSTTIFLQCGYSRGTKDSDILELEEIPHGEELLKLAGEGTPFATRHRMYLQLVKRGIPFLPPRPNFHSLDSLNVRLRNFKLLALDIVDVVVSKLRPFRAQDQEDIRAVIELELVEHEKLLERFLLAKDRWLLDARCPELPKYVENLNTVERDILLFPESRIELPDYVFNE